MLDEQLCDIYGVAEACNHERCHAKVNAAVDVAGKIHAYLRQGWVAIETGSDKCGIRQPYQIFAE